MSAFLEVLEGDWVASNALAFAIRDGFAVSPGHTPGHHSTTGGATGGAQILTTGPATPSSSHQTRGGKPRESQPEGGR